MVYLFYLVKKNPLLCPPLLFRKHYEIPLAQTNNLVYNNPAFTLMWEELQAVVEITTKSGIWVNLSCAGRPCFNSSDKVLVLLSCLSFHQPPGLCFFFLWPYFIHMPMPERSRAFVHGFAFLHLWSGLVKLVVGLLYEAVFLSNVQYSCSLRVFHMTSVVGKDTY